MSDRFARLKTDPRFRKPKRHANKVQIDPRFQSVLEAKPKKKGSNRVDKYGRKLAATHEEDELRKFYRLDVEDEEEKRKPMTGLDYARGEALMESSSEGSDSEGERKRDRGEEEEDESESDLGGDVVLGEDSSRPITIRELEEQAGEVDLDESQFALLDEEAARNLEADQDTSLTHGDGAKPTNRIAAVNLDWDHVRATHLFRIFSSLLSLHPSSTNTKKNNEPGRSHVHGELLHVRIYPSEFGKKKMAEEDKSGPPTDLFLKKKRNKGEESSKPVTSVLSRQRIDDENENEDEDIVPKPNNGEEYDQSALRRYQLERLRYYYAIATFSTISAASYVYSELDGTELERSANLFDLSYVPNDMTFEEDEKREEATRESMATVKDYKGLDFTTDALRHSKVKLTWDDDDPERIKLTRRALSEKEIEEMDFRALLASSSSSSSEEEDNDNHMNVKGGDANKSSKKEKAKERAARLRSLLLSGNEENIPEGWTGGSGGKAGDAGEMEITFIPGLSAPDAEAGDGKKQKKSGEMEETTLERYQRKEREKKRAKKEKRKEKLLGVQNQGVDEDGSGGSEEDGDGGPPRKKKGKKGRVDGDGFFGSDSGSDEGDDDAPTSKRGKKQKGETFDPATRAELALLVDDDEIDVLGTGVGTRKAKHFDMNEIIRAEKKKEKGGNSKWDKKKEKKKRKREDEGANARAVEDEVELNMTDPRFKAVHEDHRFAIDPANPHFKKTKNMKKLLYGKDSDNGVANGERKKKRPRKV
ncbi:pre-rRNA-processing protein esf1 [Serendipita sp. 405]|nr:pre-rRNA-processing protein esf1 [Serendipita sp. 405]